MSAGLMDPTERNFEKRVRRFSEMYMGNDPALGPGSQNYDPQHRSVHTNAAYFVLHDTFRLRSKKWWRFAKTACDLPIEQLSES